MTSILTKLDAIEARAAKATSGPWRACKADNDGCSCGLIWATPADLVVAVASGDVIDAVWSDQARRAHADFIANARTDIVDVCRDLRRAVELLEDAQGVALDVGHPLMAEAIAAFLSGDK